MKQEPELFKDQLAREAHLMLQAAGIHRRASLKLARAGNGREARDGMIAAGVAFDKAMKFQDHRAQPRRRARPTQTREELAAELERVKSDD